MLKLRIVTALIALAVLLLVVFAAPPIVVEVAIGLLTIAGAWEWSGLLGLRSGALRWVYVTVIGACAAGLYFFGADLTQALLLVALGWWLAALLWVLFYPTPVPRLVAWVGGLLVLLPFFIALTLLYRAGPETLMFVLLIVWAADVGAYFAGRLFGRNKLAPQISPGKTWEGVYGGLVAAAIIGAAGAVWFGGDWIAIVPFCVAVACISIVGDLTVSIFKRNAGVKDSGKLFPGHGGVLDRVDSVSAASPVFVLGLAWLGLS